MTPVLASAHWCARNKGPYEKLKRPVLKESEHQTEVKCRSCREGSEKADVLGYSPGPYLLDNMSSVSLETQFSVLVPSNFAFWLFLPHTLISSVSVFQSENCLAPSRDQSLVDGTILSPEL